MKILLMMVLLVVANGIEHCRKYAQKVLLVSMDGFRWDYINKYATPNFDVMAQKGTTTKYVNNTFVTKTFPCHYTIVTGLYEESHGIISNRMYDPVFNEYFTMRSHEPKWWNGGEPLWVTAKNHGLRSGTVFWPGSEVKIRGVRPDKWLNYSDTMPFMDRINMATDWLKNEDLDLVTLYFNEPDKTGHAHGPDSPEMQAMVEQMDTWLGKLIKKLQDEKLSDIVNVIVTSDHGMTGIDLQNKLVDVEPVLHLVNQSLDSGPIMQFTPKPGEASALVAALNNISHVRAYKKEDIPEHWHYKNNRRIMEVFAVADEGWSLTPNMTLAKLITEKGNHGYDNALDSMKPIFFAQGPNIQSKMTLEPFNSVDIYPLVCELLGIKASVNNGTLDNTRSLLNPYTDVATCGVGQIQTNIFLIALGVLFKMCA